jgi:hypothetical protein
VRWVGSVKHPFNTCVNRWARKGMRPPAAAGGRVGRSWPTTEGGRFLPTLLGPAFPVIVAAAATAATALFAACALKQSLSAVMYRTSCLKFECKM